MLWCPTCGAAMMPSTEAVRVCSGEAMHKSAFNVYGALQPYAPPAEPELPVVEAPPVYVPPDDPKDSPRQKFSKQDKNEAPSAS